MLTPSRSCDAGRSPGRTDVVVRIEASGICHSDVSVLTGDLPAPLPVVLGHEGAGVVDEVGADVTTVRPGDRVVLSAIPTCGTLLLLRPRRAVPVRLCRRHCAATASPTARRRSAARRAWGRSPTPSSSRSWRRCPVRTDLPAEQLALLGCAVVTGTGSAINLASIGPGDSVLVIGAGGDRAVRAAGRPAEGRHAADRRRPGRRQPRAGDEVRRDAHLRPAARTTSPRAVAELTGGIGVDTVIDCVGSTATLDQAWALSRRGWHDRRDRRARPGRSGQRARWPRSR